MALVSSGRVKRLLTRALKASWSNLSPSSGSGALLGSACRDDEDEDDDSSPRGRFWEELEDDVELGLSEELPFSSTRKILTFLF